MLVDTDYKFEIYPKRYSNPNFVLKRKKQSLSMMVIFGFTPWIYSGILYLQYLENLQNL